MEKFFSFWETCPGQGRQRGVVVLIFLLNNIVHPLPENLREIGNDFSSHRKDRMAS
jgi:hypothetical protein